MNKFLLNRNGEFNVDVIENYLTNNLKIKIVQSERNEYYQSRVSVNTTVQLLLNNNIISESDDTFYLPTNIN